MQTLYLLVPLAPLAAAIVVGLFGPQIGRRASHWLCILGVAAATLASYFVLRDVIAGNVFNGDALHLARLGDLKLAIGFLIDPLTAMMMLVVSFVSLMVHVYTIGYMADDPGYTRFFSYISLFTFSMLMLVMSNNFLQLFFGWEAVGLVSYLLIGFWYTRPTAIYATSRRSSSTGSATSASCSASAWCSRISARSTMRRCSPGRRSLRQATMAPWSGGRVGAADGHLHLPVHRRDGQVGAGSAARLAARLDGRPDADLGADPCRDHGHRRHLHGRADERRCSSSPTPRWGSSS